MKFSAKPKAALAGFLTLTLIGCSGTNTPPTAVAPDLPPPPAPCITPTPHARLAPGEDALFVLARERAQLGYANSKQAVCAKFYRELKAGLAQPGAPK